MEAHRDLLACALAEVDDDVVGAAVDPGEAGDLDGDAGFLGDLADGGLGRGFADVDPAAGKLPVPVVGSPD